MKVYRSHTRLAAPLAARWERIAEPIAGRIAEQTASRKRDR